MLFIFYLVGQSYSKWFKKAEGVRVPHRPQSTGELGQVSDTGVEGRDRGARTGELGPGGWVEAGDWDRGRDRRQGRGVGTGGWGRGQGWATGMVGWDRGVGTEGLGQGAGMGAGRGV